MKNVINQVIANYYDGELCEVKVLYHRSDTKEIFAKKIDDIPNTAHEFLRLEDQINTKLICKLIDFGVKMSNYEGQDSFSQEISQHIRKYPNAYNRYS